MSYEIKDKNDKVCHIIHRKEEIVNERTNISNQGCSLQICSMKLPIKKFRAHRHLPLERNITGTPECWIVISGWIAVDYYDEENNFITSVYLFEGDMTFSYSGAGHNYRVCEQNTKVYEIKQGPYFGIEKDKEFIDG